MNLLYHHLLLLLLLLLSSFQILAIELNQFYLASLLDLPQGSNGSTVTSSDYTPFAPDWIQVNTPCTVIACLMQAGLVPNNIFVGDLIDQINQTRFDTTWIYWTSFTLPSTSTFVSLRLLGINYRAHIYLNGVQLDDEIIGMYTINEIDLSSNAFFGVENKLAISVDRQYDIALGSNASTTIDLGVSFVDWTYSDPPDYNLGIWRKVFLETHGPITLRYPGVSTSLSEQSHQFYNKYTTISTIASPISFSYANLTVLTEIRNFDKNLNTSGNLFGQVSTITGSILCSFSIPLIVPADSELSISISVDQSACLKVLSPNLWWPWQMGSQTLHLLNLSFTLVSSNVSSDSLVTTFGIRTATSSLDINGNRLFLFNTLPFLVRGGGWSPDLFQRVDDTRLASTIALTRDLGVNAIRFEGKMEPDELFDLMDSIGIVGLPGWCCCDAWQHWPNWKDEQYTIAAKSMLSQALRLRKFASILGFLISSDELPPQDVEQLYLDALNKTQWFKFATTISAASKAVSKITGSTGVKMSGPYSWVPPSYWLEDNGTYAAGGAFGFLTEGGPGETPLTLESLLAIVPQNSSTWPPTPSNSWNKAGNPLGNFAFLDRFNTPLKSRYGTYNATGGGNEEMKMYLSKATAMSIEGHKAFCEGYSRNKYTLSTGFIQWMLNDATPSNIWHFIQYDLTIGPAGVAAKQALSPPLHIAYDYSKRSIYVINSLYSSAPSIELIAKIEVFTLSDVTIFQANTTISINSISADGVFDIPELTPPLPIVGGGAFFLRLSIKTSTSGESVDTNIYWLPEEKDVIDWKSLTWYNVLVSTYANLTSLFSTTLIPPQGVETSAVFSTISQQFISTGAQWLSKQQRDEEEWTRANITVVNNGPNIAFLIRLRIVPIGGPFLGVSDPSPIFFSDNYLVLRVGESRIIFAEFPNSILNGNNPSVVWDFAV